MITISEKTVVVILQFSGVICGWYPLNKEYKEYQVCMKST